MFPNTVRSSRGRVRASARGWQFDPTGALLRLYDVPTGGICGKRRCRHKRSSSRRKIRPCSPTWIKGNTIVDGLPKKFSRPVSPRTRRQGEWRTAAGDAGQYFFVLNKPSERAREWAVPTRTWASCARRRRQRRGVRVRQAIRPARLVGAGLVTSTLARAVPAVADAALFVDLPGAGRRPGASYGDGDLSIDKRTGKRLWDRRGERSPTGLGRPSTPYRSMPNQVRLTIAPRRLRQIDDGANAPGRRRPARQGEESFNTRKPLTSLVPCAVRLIQTATCSRSLLDQTMKVPVMRSLVAVRWRLLWPVSAELRAEKLQPKHRAVVDKGLEYLAKNQRDGHWEAMAAGTPPPSQPCAA